MRLVTHCNISGAPADHKWIAAYYREDRRLAVYFPASTEAEVVAKAEAWLAAEDAKIEGQKAFHESLTQRMAERARKKAEAA